MDRRQPGGELVPGGALVGRTVEAPVGGAERGERSVGQRVQTIGVDVVVEPLGKPGPAALEDLEIVADSEDLELLQDQDVEFYAWLDEQ